MCLRADATTSAIHVRLILPGECHGDYPPRLCHTPFTRIWPHEELCRFSALVDYPWKWCASCWRKIAISHIDPVSDPRPATSQLHRDPLPRSPPAHQRQLQQLRASISSAAAATASAQRERSERAYLFTT